MIAETGRRYRPRARRGDRRVRPTTVRLSRMPTGTVYVTVSAPAAECRRGGRDRSRRNGLAVQRQRRGLRRRVRRVPPSLRRRRRRDGRAAARGRPRLRRLELERASQTVHVYAVDDEAQEGDRTVAISHSVIAPDPADRTAADGAAVRNVEVPSATTTSRASRSSRSPPAPDAEDRTTLVLEDDVAGIADEIRLALEPGLRGRADPPRPPRRPAPPRPRRRARLALQRGDPRHHLPGR